MNNELTHLLNKVNKVTSYHRHGNTIPPRVLDDLANAQLDYEQNDGRMVQTLKLAQMVADMDPLPDDPESIEMWAKQLADDISKGRD